MYFAYLNHVVCLESLLLAWLNAVPIYERSIRAIQVFDREASILPNNYRVVARRPDSIRSFLCKQVNVDRLLIGTSKNILPFIYWIFGIWLRATNDDEPSLYLVPLECLLAANRTHFLCRTAKLEHSESHQGANCEQHEEKQKCNRCMNQVNWFHARTLTANQ